MRIDSAQWRQLIIDGAATFDIIVTPQQAEAFACHALELVHWNRKINLTAIVEPRQLAIKHFLDAIAPLKWIPDQGELIDVGTGGGFPGLALGVMRPQQPMTLIDGSRKKITFVKQMIHQLQLPHAEALQSRAEDLGRQPAYHQRFRTIVSRAMADPWQVVEVTRNLLAPQGKIVVYQGPGTDIGVGRPLADIDCSLQVFDYCLPFSDHSRKLLIFHF